MQEPHENRSMESSDNLFEVVRKALRRLVALLGERVAVELHDRQQTGKPANHIDDSTGVSHFIGDPDQHIAARPPDEN